MWPFVEGAIDRAVFESIVADAYAGSDTPEVCPVVDLEPDGRRRCRCSSSTGVPRWRSRTSRCSWWGGCSTTC